MFSGEIALTNNHHYYYYQRRACLSSIGRKESQYLFAFSTDDIIETLDSSAITDRQSIIAMFLTVLYIIDGLETETLK